MVNERLQRIVLKFATYERYYDKTLKVFRFKMAFEVPKMEQLFAATHSVPEQEYNSEINQESYDRIVWRSLASAIVAKIERSHAKIIKNQSTASTRTTTEESSQTP